MSAPAAMTLLRLRGWLAGLWAGAVLCIGALAAPSLFAVLERAQAGLAAGRMFKLEAALSLALAVVLLLVERRVAARRVESGAARSLVSAELLLVLGVLFCTVAGYYALIPLMEEARAGTGRWTFMQLHGVSSAFFGVKALLLAALAWRCAAPR
jgi:hypothetical protein